MPAILIIVTRDDLIEAGVVGAAAGAGAGIAGWIIAAQFPALLALDTTTPNIFDSQLVAIGQFCIAGFTTFVGVLVSKCFDGGP